MSEFKTYEYTTITASRKEEALYTDCYRSFGWQAAEGREAVLPNPDKIALKLKRDRKIKNRAEVNVLQRKCENALSAIGALERRKNASALTAAFILGFIGTAFMALSVFNIAVFTANIALCIVFGVLGFIGWGLGYFSYTKVQKAQAAKTAPLIEEQYDIVYDTCEQAGVLLG